MRGPGSASEGVMAFKRELIKNLLLGLRARAAEACSFDAMMSVEDRKRAVKRPADVAMAAARGAAAGGGRARWPKAILAAAASGSISSGSSSPSACKARTSRCRRVVRRCVGAKRMTRRGCYAAAGSSAAAAAATSSDVARRLVRRRTMALRKVIPGGDAARDEAALLREAMDYVVHLRAQVDVLRRVSAAVQRSTFPRDPAQSMEES